MNANRVEQGYLEKSLNGVAMVAARTHSI